MGAQQCRPATVEVSVAGHNQLLARVAHAVAEATAQPTGCGTVRAQLADNPPAKDLGLEATELDLAATIYHSVTYRDVEDLGDILEGALALVLGDFGWLYELIAGMDGAYRCVTPHESSAPQYAVKLLVLGTVLTGRDSRGNSWVQFEPNASQDGSGQCSAASILEFHFSGLSGPPVAD